MPVVAVVVAFFIAIHHQEAAEEEAVVIKPVASQSKRVIYSLLSWGWEVQEEQEHLTEPPAARVMYHSERLLFARLPAVEVAKVQVILEVEELQGLLMDSQEIPGMAVRAGQAEVSEVEQVEDLMKMEILERDVVLVVVVRDLLLSQWVVQRVEQV